MPVAGSDICSCASSVYNIGETAGIRKIFIVFTLIPYL